MGSWTATRVTFLQASFERLGGIATTATGDRFAKYVQQVLGYIGVHDMKSAVTCPGACHWPPEEDAALNRNMKPHSRHGRTRLLWTPSLL